MKFLGRLRGTGTLVSGDETIGPAEYDLDGYTTRPGEVVASGELRMPAVDLQRCFGQHDLRLLGSDGRVLHLRFSGKHSESHGDAAHIDVTDGLPPAKDWRH
ncbi:MAG: hypothetical protein KIS73_05530 [Enhydrobacter sp.]|nr:hypothetical protein [Enhydrobacter sp.]